MKKHLSIIALATLLLWGCDKESYYHTMGIIYPNGYKALYADQNVDSVVIFVTDNFSLTSNASWAKLPSGADNTEVKNVYRVVYHLVALVNLDANTTGEVREAIITLHSSGSDDWDHTAYTRFYQDTLLNITNPLPAYSYKDGTKTGAAFLDSIAAVQDPDTLKFHSYGDWSLTDGEFIHPRVMSGSAGDYAVVLDVDANTVEEERETVVVLTSRGVSNKVRYIQKAAKL